MSDEETNTDQVNKINVTDHDEPTDNNEVVKVNDFVTDKTPDLSDESNKSEESESHDEPKATVTPSVPVTPSAPETTSAPESSAPTVQDNHDAPKWTDHPVVASMKQKYSHHYAVVGVLVLLVVVFGAWALMLSGKNSDLKKQVATLNSQVAADKANPQALVQSQTDALIAKVGQLMTLPTGETPTVAAVSDATQAKQQSAFFTNAQNGDKVLVYVKAGKAILYRPSTDKIVLVAPLTINNTAATTTPAKR